MRFLKPVLFGIGLALVIDVTAAWAFLWFYDSPTVDV